MFASSTSVLVVLSRLDACRLRYCTEARRKCPNGQQAFKSVRQSLFDSGRAVGLNISYMQCMPPMTVRALRGTCRWPFGGRDICEACKSIDVPPLASRGTACRITAVELEATKSASGRLIRSRYAAVLGVGFPSILGRSRSMASSRPARVG